MLERKEIKETKHNFLIVLLLSLHWLQDTVKTAGAEVSGEGIVETFHNDEEALDAADNGVAVSILLFIFSFSFHKQLRLVETLL